MVDYNDFILVLKLSWIRRLIYLKFIWVNLLEISLNIIVNNLWLRGIDFLFRFGNIMYNCFWKEVFYSWQKIIDILVFKNENIYSEYIWYNLYIRIGSNLVFLKSYFYVGFIFIIDFFDLEGNFISFEFFNNLYVNINFLEYVGFKKVVLDRIGIYNIKEVRIKI